MAEDAERCPVCDRPYAPQGCPWSDETLCYVWVGAGRREGLPTDASPAADCATHAVNWREEATRLRGNLVSAEAGLAHLRQQLRVTIVSPLGWLVDSRTHLSRETTDG